MHRHHKTLGSRLRRAAGVPVVVLLLTAWGGSAVAVERSPVEDDPTLAMARTQFRARWLVGDHASLARLIAEKGAVMSLARDDRGARTTTPSRAHYVFKSLFRATEGHVLETVAVSPGAMGDIVHTVLDWTYRRSGSEESDRLFVTWVRERAGWRLAELRTGH